MLAAEVEHTKATGSIEEGLKANASQVPEISALVDLIAGNSTSPELLTTSNAKSYLAHLVALPLNELQQEPVILQTQSHHLTSSLTSFTHTSYPTFLSLHQTTTALTTSLESLSSSLDDLLGSDIPSFEECTNVWKERTEAILQERNKARVVLEQHEKIRDLLDIPVLIDTCVRNAYFAEALSLISHVGTLATSTRQSDKDTKYKSIPPAILASVLAEVQHSTSQMLLSLLATLYEPNRKLPSLWKAVNFLRKMDAFGSGSGSPISHFLPGPHHKPSSSLVHRECKSNESSSEEQLALTFLIARESCLKTTLSLLERDIQRLVHQVHVPEVIDVVKTGAESQKEGEKMHKGKRKELDEPEREDLARYLKKYIDIWREGVYDIITQYATIFLERGSSMSASKVDGHGSSDTPEDELVLSRLHTLLRTYATRALVTHLFSNLDPSLPLLSLGHLPSLITQLNYCSNAFARLGLDFRSMLFGSKGIFTSTVLSIVQRELEMSADRWLATLRKARGTSAAASVTKMTENRRGTTSTTSLELPSKWLILPSLATSPPSPPIPKNEASNSPVHIPPQILSSYPPIAELTNSILSLFNGLRLIVPRAPIVNEAINGSHDTSHDVGNTCTASRKELLKLLDDVLFRCGACLSDYLNIVFLSVSQSDGTAEQKREMERERMVALGAGRVYSEIFEPFVRRALMEGIYGIKIEDRARETEMDLGNPRNGLRSVLVKLDGKENKDGERDGEEDQVDNESE